MSHRSPRGASSARTRNCGLPGQFIQRADPPPIAGIYTKRRPAGHRGDARLTRGLCSMNLTSEAGCHGLDLLGDLPRLISLSSRSEKFVFYPVLSGSPNGSFLPTQLSSHATVHNSGGTFNDNRSGVIGSILAKHRSSPVLCLGAASAFRFRSSETALREDRKRFMSPGAVFLQYGPDGKINRIVCLSER